MILLNAQETYGRWRLGVAVGYSSREVNSFAATAVAGGGVWMLAKFINNPHYVGSLRATAGSPRVFRKCSATEY